MAGIPSHEQNGVISIRSSASLIETIERLLVALARRGMVIYAGIDHAKEPEAVGLRLRPTRLFVAGYPDADSPLIARSQLLGTELPQKILVWKDEDSAVWISYNDPIRLSGRSSVAKIFIRSSKQSAHRSGRLWKRPEAGRRPLHQHSPWGNYGVFDNSVA
jgi:uncharacterized protein (DUF302 family)